MNHPQPSWDREGPRKFQTVQNFRGQTGGLSTVEITVLEPYKHGELSYKHRELRVSSMKVIPNWFTVCTIGNIFTPKPYRLMGIVVTMLSVRLSVNFWLVDRISQDRLNIATSFLQYRCIMSRSRTSSKLGHLDLLFKVTELFIQYSG